MIEGPRWKKVCHWQNKDARSLNAEGERIMKTRKCGIEGYLKANSSGEETFPEKATEVKAYCEREKISEEKFFSYAWRGRTLSFQAGAPQTEEQKATAKEERAIKSKALQMAEAGAREAGVDLISFVRLAVQKKEASK